MMFSDTLTYKSAGEVNSAMTRVYGHMSLAVVVSMVVSMFVCVCVCVCVCVVCSVCRVYRMYRV